MATQVWKNPGEHPFLQIGHTCMYVGTGGGEGQVKGDGGRVHLEKLQEVKSEMMTGVHRCTLYLKLILYSLNFGAF